MTDKPAFDPLKCGLWAALVGRDGVLNVPAWTRAEASGDVVGTCRVCGGYVVADQPKPDGQISIIWYVGRCVDCNHEVASPNGRLLRRSSRAGERPNGGNR